MNPTDLAQTITEMELRLPERPDDLTQDEEWFELAIDGETRRIRFHDYAEAYAVPGVYERLFYEELKCDSPRTVCEARRAAHQRRPERRSCASPCRRRQRDGREKSQELEVDQIGVDIIEEAAQATERDRPGVYDDYYVLDLTKIPEPAHAELRSQSSTA